MSNTPTQDELRDLLHRVKNVATDYDAMQFIEAYKDNACRELLDRLIASADSEGRLWVETILAERYNLNKTPADK